MEVSAFSECFLFFFFFVFFFFFFCGNIILDFGMNFIFQNIFLGYFLAATCKGKCGENSEPCACDTACVGRGDCCADYTDQCGEFFGVFFFNLYIK